MFLIKLFIYEFGGRDSQIFAENFSTSELKVSFHKANTRRGFLSEISVAVAGQSARGCYNNPVERWSPEGARCVGNRQREGGNRATLAHSTMDLPLIRAVGKLLSRALLASYLRLSRKKGRRTLSLPSGREAIPTRVFRVVNRQLCKETRRRRGFASARFNFENVSRERFRRKSRDFSHE